MATSTPADAVPAKNKRQITPVVLVVIAGILSLLTVLAIWANRQLLNPDRWANTSTQLLQKQSIRQATANYLVDQIYTNVNVDDQVSNALKALDGTLGISSTAKSLSGSSLLDSSSLNSLSGPIAEALRGAAKDGVAAALETTLVQDLWRQANKTADQSLVAVVDGKKGPVGLESGVVTLDLNQVVNNVTKQLGLGSVISLPSNVGNVVILRSNQVKSVQDMGRLLRSLPWILLPLAVVFYSLALLMTLRGRRRRLLMGIGASLVCAGLAVIVIRTLMVSQLPGQLAADASVLKAVRDVVRVATSLMLNVANSTWQLGMFVIIGAWLAGPSKFAVAARKACAPLLRRESWTIFAAVFAILVVLIIWQPIEITRQPLGMLLLLVFGLIGAEFLRREMLVEFPAGMAGPSWADGAGERVSGIAEDAAHRAGTWAKSLRLPKVSISRPDAPAEGASGKASADLAEESPTVEEHPTLEKSPAVDESPTVAQHPATDEYPTTEAKTVSDEERTVDDHDDHDDHDDLDENRD